MIYKTKEFTSLTKKESLSDNDLIKACTELKNGLYDADLGGNTYKKRIASGNKGKSGGYRTIIGKSIGQPLIEINNINKLIKNDTQCGYDNPTVKLSQTMDNFQQQQTGRLL